MKIHISYGNSKLGRVANISLWTIGTCPPKALCRHECYAKLLERYHRVEKPWKENFQLFVMDEGDYFSQLKRFLKGYQGKYFRYHVGGDIPNQTYLRYMKEIATDFPQIVFNCYTKRYGLNFLNTPSNLIILISCWPGMDLPPEELRRFTWFWYQNGAETRIPSSHFVCRRDCPACMKCWDPFSERTDIVTKKHGQMRLFHACK
jgi:hypothetical protein